MDCRGHGRDKGHSVFLLDRFEFVQRLLLVIAAIAELVRLLQCWGLAVALISAWLLLFIRVLALQRLSLKLPLPVGHVMHVGHVLWLLVHVRVRCTWWIVAPEWHGRGGIGFLWLSGLERDPLQVHEGVLRQRQGRLPLLLAETRAAHRHVLGSTTALAEI